MSSSWSYYVLYIHPTGLVATAIMRPNWYSNAFRTEKNNYPATTILTFITVICENGTAALFKFSHSFVTWKCPSIFFPVLFICYICDKLKISSCTHKIDLYTILTVHLCLVLQWPTSAGESLSQWRDQNVPEALRCCNAEGVFSAQYSWRAYSRLDPAIVKVFGIKLCFPLECRNPVVLSSNCYLVLFLVSAYIWTIWSFTSNYDAINENVLDFSVMWSACCEARNR